MKSKIMLGRAGWSVCAALLLTSIARADSTVTDTVRQSEGKQVEIKTQTQRASEELSVIIDEFDRNGLGGEDVQILKGIKNILGNLSDKDMGRVIELLQVARNAADS